MTAANSDAPAARATTPSAARRAKLAALTQPVRPGPSTAVLARGLGGAPQSATLSLSNSKLRLDIAPSLGGAVTRFDWRGNGDVTTPIFRRAVSIEGDTDPNALACYPLVPYSNRIGGASFRFGGRHVSVPRNRDAEPLPIHGDGWLQPWELVESGPANATLALDRSRGKPYAYRATLAYELDGATLVVTLSAENAGREALPFGLGLHPFLPRHGETHLSAAAGGLWLSGDDWLPVRHVPVPPAWQFGVAYPLPGALVNHAFTGWSGHAAVVWPEKRLSLTIAANADYYVLYTPPGEDFFCFEPVDHPINAVNLPGGADAHGMTVLAPGEGLTREFRFTVSRVGV
ncbi:aldose 1-epimerase [Trinickia caryophylli]|uniref:Aldose 1-epimerase n=1 Tax=Trinickia caryophylli TaxID=28094 RepID=A0A1X7CAF7_TRICW|nr:aldose 1-epimerase [Trinickia caryophylli]PMS12423.1 aldose 1-epimerase [Trinickia caryophylli]TRX19621.1 aldose 1-epimerase [Trinickia caryophylli]WQE13064.1 aldose 1-epimerase [Trinickia caryophylli]SME92965.1 aldose 1-epimerase [Trinickia caryophylli]GLU30802.1 aldose 1-epimerase [Trinickia caryophylli]